MLDFLCFGGFYVEGCFWGFVGMAKIFFVIFLRVVCRWHTGGNAVAMPWHCHGIALAWSAKMVFFDLLVKFSFVMTMSFSDYGVGFCAGLTFWFFWLSMVFAFGIWRAVMVTEYRDDDGAVVLTVEDVREVEVPRFDVKFEMPGFGHPKFEMPDDDEVDASHRDMLERMSRGDRQRRWHGYWFGDSDAGPGFRSLLFPLYGGKSYRQSLANIAAAGRGRVLYGDWDLNEPDTVVEEFSKGFADDLRRVLGKKYVDRATPEQLKGDVERLQMQHSARQVDVESVMPPDICRDELAEIVELCDEGVKWVHLQDLHETRPALNPQDGHSPEEVRGKLRDLFGRIRALAVGPGDNA